MTKDIAALTARALHCHTLVPAVNNRSSLNTYTTDFVRNQLQYASGETKRLELRGARVLSSAGLKYRDAGGLLARATVLEGGPQHEAGAYDKLVVDVQVAEPKVGQEGREDDRNGCGEPLEDVVGILQSHGHRQSGNRLRDTK